MIGTQEAQASFKSLYLWHLVLVVDDDPETLSAIRRELAREPYDVVTTDRPALALEWLERKKVSLVISDQRMPEMQGDLFLEGVWKKSPGTARLLLTGYPESVSSIPASRRSLLKVMTKPWDSWELKRTIRELLHEREETGGGVQAD
ncbi:MAG TPA: response regulator [Planctomycetota bacterium]|nr:response regulator [Planctomycetota bacterium]